MVCMGKKTDVDGGEGDKKRQVRTRNKAAENK